MYILQNVKGDQGKLETKTKDVQKDRTRVVWTARGRQWSIDRREGNEVWKWEDKEKVSSRQVSIFNISKTGEGIAVKSWMCRLTGKSKLSLKNWNILYYQRKL